MNVIFKAQVEYNSKQSTHSSAREVSSTKDTTERFDWNDKELVNKCIVNQNKVVEEGRFDPTEYFGGFKPYEIQTGIVRKVIKEVFAPEPTMVPIKPPTGHNHNSSKCLTSTHKKPKVGNSSSQPTLEPSKCPRLAEISESLQISQNKINGLMQNLKILN